jgi:metal-responsive CopG/Arc/MetJ family transcriptional regulator
MREGDSMFRSKIKLDPDLLKRVKKYADVAGYSSVEEFIEHALEKELAKLEDAGSEEELRQRLRGLGYIS